MTHSGNKSGKWNTGATAAIGIVRHLGRGIKRLAIGVGGVLFLAAMLLIFLLFTQPGRDLVRDVAVQQTNTLIPGTIEIDTIPQLNLSGAEINGVRIIDPRQKVVARIGRIVVHPNWSGIFKGVIDANLVMIDNAFVDARDMDKRTAGLIAAFVDPNSPPSQPSPNPPPEIRIHQYRLKNIQANLPPLPKTGELQVMLNTLNGAMSLNNGIPAGRVDTLHLVVHRDDKELLELRGEANVPVEKSASSVTLNIDAGNMKAALTATARLPIHPDWELAPASLQVSVTGVTGAQLAKVLNDPSLTDAFNGEAELHLTARGKDGRFSVEGAITTAAGIIRFDELQLHEKQIRFALSTSGFKLHALRADLPDDTVATRLAIDSQGFPTNPVHFALHMDQTKVNNIALPKIDAAGVYHDNMISDLTLTVHEPNGRMDANGVLNLTGESKLKLQAALQPPLIKRLGKIAGQDIDGRLTVSTNVRLSSSGHISSVGKLTLDDFAYRKPNAGAPDEITLKKLTADFSAAGNPPRLTGKLDGKITDLTRGNQHLDNARLHISGNPSNVNLTLNAEGGTGPRHQNGERPKRKSIQLSIAAEVARKGKSTVIEGHGTGHLLGRPLQFDLGKTKIADNGAFQSGGLNLNFSGQRLRLKGGLSPHRRAGDTLVIDFGPIRLDDIPEVLAIHPDLKGTIDGTVRISGTSNVPVVDMTVSGHQLGLKRRPLVDAHFQASLDARNGTAGLSASLSSPDGLAISANASATFKGGVNWLNRIHLAEIDSTIVVAELKSPAILPYFPNIVLPFTVTSGAHIHAKGTLEAPWLELKTRAHLWTMNQKPVAVLLNARYGGGALDADVQIDDEKGTFATLGASLVLPGTPPAVNGMADAFSRAASNGKWHLNLDVAERSLREIPILKSFVDGGTLPSVDTKLSLAATHNGSDEPVIHLNLQAKQSAAWTVNGCEASGMILTAIVDHQNNDNHLTVTGAQKNKTLLLLDATVPLAILPVLQGEKPLPGQLDFNLHTNRLKLTEIPFICGVAEGEMEGTVAGTDVLGTFPQISAKLNVQSFSLGSNETVDVNLDMTALSSEVILIGEIRGSDEQRKILGLLSTTIPIRYSNGNLSIEQNIPINASIRMNHLPIAPLLPPEGAISYARGYLQGDVKAGGKLESPLFFGHLALQDVAFTSTSLAQPLRRVQGKLRFNKRKIKVTHFEAHDRDGAVTLHGMVDLTNMNRIYGKMHIKAEDFPLRQQGQVVATTSFNAVAETTVTPKRTNARLTLNDVDTWLETATPRTGIDLAANEDFVIDGIAAPGAVSAGEKADNNVHASDTNGANTAAGKLDNTITIIIKGKKNFWVKRKDFAVKLNTRLKTEIAGDSVRVNGNVVINRGYLQLFGREFNFSPESIVRFTGSNPPNPELDLSAEYRTRNESVVGVEIKGRSDAPELTFIVNGDEVEAGVAMQEIFGADTRNANADASTQAKSFVSGLTAGVLATAARRELGAAAPIIMIDPSENTGEGRVRAGFELDSIVPGFLRPIVTGVYLEGIVQRESQGNTNAQTEFGALLELYFPKNFFAAAQYGPGTTWSVDLGWQL